jgi:formate-dependent nitrite reductase cytochrome c552 subunit
MQRPDRDTPEFREKNREYQNDWYHKNKESALATRRQRLQQLRKQYQEYKLTKSCIKCGESHPACLDFHHPNPAVKDLNPSQLVTQKGWSFAKIVAELDSLEVLCANCHRKVHFKLRSA